MQYDIQYDVHQSHNGGCDAFSSFLHSIVFSCNLSTGIYGNYLFFQDFIHVWFSTLSEMQKKSLIIWPFEHWGFAFNNRVTLAQFKQSVCTFKLINLIVLDRLFYTKDFNMYCGILIVSKVIWFKCNKYVLNLIVKSCIFYQPVAQS